MSPTAHPRVRVLSPYFVPEDVPKEAIAYVAVQAEAEIVGRRGLPVAKLLSPSTEIATKIAAWEFPQEELAANVHWLPSRWFLASAIGAIAIRPM